MRGLMKPPNLKGGCKFMKKFLNIRLAAVSLLLAMTVASIGPMFAATPAFSDVPTSHWAYEQINRCVQDGIVSGYADGTFSTSCCYRSR